MADGHHDKAEELALFRYQVISEAASPRLSPAQRGRLARELAARSWVTPEGTERQISRTSIDRWLAAYTKDGLAGLAPVPRSDRGRPRAAAQWLDEAAKLRRAVPARSAAQIVDIIGRAHGVWLSERTVRGHLHRLGLSRQALSAAPAHAFGRFEADRPNEILDRRRLARALRPSPARPGLAPGQTVPARRRLQPPAGARALGDRREHPGRPRRAAIGHFPPGPARIPVCR